MHVACKAKVNPEQFIISLLMLTWKLGQPTIYSLLHVNTVQLVEHFLKEKCVNPTFMMNYPEIMSPMAKGNRSKPGLTERFELFINKHKVLCT